MMALILNTLMWLLSVLALGGYFYRVVLQRPFATVAKHFGIVMVVHVVLNGLALVLSQLDWSGMARPQSAPMGMKWALMLFTKLYMALLVVALIGFAAAFAKKMVERVAGFHQQHNAQNVHRQPIHGLIRHQKRIVVGYQALFVLGGVMMLWAVWFRMLV